MPGPRSREKRVTSGGSGVHRRGSGLGSGPVGSGSGFGGRGGSGGGGSFRGGGGGNIFTMIAILLVLLVGGGGGLFSGLFGGGSGGNSGNGISSDNGNLENGNNSQGSAGQGASQQIGGSGSQGFDFASLASLFGSSQSAESVYGTSTGWSLAGSGGNTSSLNTEVDSRSREKFTNIKGGGRDTVTVMVYMCGTDLESKHGMGTADISEMASADISDNVNVLVYTGGCKRWRNSIINSNVNQIYQVKNGGLKCLVADDGSRAMTAPNTLTRFINWCENNFPSDRRFLILWDHGGGSISGFGYDEKASGSDSMDLSEISDAIKGSGLRFDWIGFDACLMATAENALALSPYADYLLSSEETEPGMGWYYTNWLNALSRNTSMPTTEIGKRIIDDFIDVSQQKCPGQSTTLSLVDLAELSQTLPQSFTAFSNSTASMIQNSEYKAVSTARSNSREFAASSKIDQVDLVHLANNLGTTEGKALAETILSAVKYNRTSRDMTNSYGLSIYFPAKRLSRVDSMVRTYKDIGLDDSYSKCIQKYAAVSASGQAVGAGFGNSQSPFSSLSGGDSSFGSGTGFDGLDLSSFIGGGTGQGSTGAGSLGTDLMSQIIGNMFSGRSNLPGNSSNKSSSNSSSNSSSSLSELDSSNTEFMSECGMDNEELAGIVSENQFRADMLVFTEEDGQHVLSLPEKQWSLVRKLDMNVFYDDGEGYVDLGLDNSYEFNEDGALIGDMDHTWLSINNQPVAYYHINTVENGQEYTIIGRVPALLNGERVDLILIFNNDYPYGYVTGYRTDYREGETDTLGKGVTSFHEGDRIDYVCDFYNYNGAYQDSYMLGQTEVVSASELVTVGEPQDNILSDDGDTGNTGEWHPMISNTDIGEGKALVSYRFTDLYGQEYWTPTLTN